MVQLAQQVQKETWVILVQLVLKVFKEFKAQLVHKVKLGQLVLRAQQA